MSQSQYSRPQAQIHIAGTQRTGKSTLAADLAKQLAWKFGHKCVLIDVDEVRVGLFGPDAPIGSEENGRRQGVAYEAMFALLIPAVLRAGGTPITTATHSHKHHYGRCQSVANDFNVPLFAFILLEAPSFEEVCRRAAADTGSASDMTNPTDPAQRAVYEATVARWAAAYPADFSRPHQRLQQASPEDMLWTAMGYIEGRGQ